MKYQNNRTKCGKFMFNFSLRCSKFLMNHIWLYYILNYTWGILTTFIGWLVYGIISFFPGVVGKGKFGPCCYIMFGNNWGGLSIGKIFFIADKMGEEWTEHTKQHECGHSFHNAIFGPLAIFLVFIPSVIRYWIQKLGKSDKPYDQIWFEGSASTIGVEYLLHQMHP